MKREGGVSVLLLCLCVLLLYIVNAIHAAPNSSWNCTVVSKPPSSPLPYQVLNCTGLPLPPDSMDWQVGPMIFHVVTVDLTKYKLRGAEALRSAGGLQAVPDIAKNVPGALAAINGGYFWRVDSKSFIDDVCFFKFRSDAEHNVSLTNPNYGIGDGLLKVDGKVLSSNCDLPGYNAPVAITMDGTNSSIFLMDWGGRLGPEYPNALAAGPLLVDYVNGESVYGVPWWDTNLNRWEHSSNTAVGLVGKPGNFHSLLLVVSDGYDGCPSYDYTCGIEAEPMAYFMKDALGATLAMEMDQGGSSTMWLSGLGVVNSNKNNPRHVYNALFVTK